MAINNMKVNTLPFMSLGDIKYALSVGVIHHQEFGSSQNSDPNVKKVFIKK